MPCPFSPSKPPSHHLCFRQLSQLASLSFSKLHQLKMCYYQPWEDDSTQSDDSAPVIGNGFEQIEARWETRLELLEARVARIEARVEGLEARLLLLRKSLRVVCALFLITLIYAIRK